ncbi:MAG: hypothetical protein MJ252_25225 [archaeon]|nr:hypothetical protein [archaeon]
MSKNNKETQEIKCRIHNLKLTVERAEIILKIFDSILTQRLKENQKKKIFKIEKVLRSNRILERSGIQFESEDANRVSMQSVLSFEFLNKNIKEEEKNESKEILPNDSESVQPKEEKEEKEYRGYFPKETRILCDQNVKDIESILSLFSHV